MTLARFLCRIALIIAAVAGASRVAEAHPHVWVTIRSEIIYSPDGLMTGVRHAWTFDDVFSAYALQGLPQATKGAFTREELSSLAEVNVTSLKEYDFFTYAKADGTKAAFREPIDYWLDYKDAALTLHFTLPLKKPIAPKQALIEIYDPTMFVSFDLAKDKPVTLSQAPQNCQVDVEAPQAPTALQQRRLGELDARPTDAFEGLGQQFSNKVRLKCA